ncbi:MAG: class I SAM-dependent methyltransferase [Acidobacteriota bacterium]|nr:class I SAM-dependent methyltransferase [Acidobacteriota bacterium]
MNKHYLAGEAITNYLQSLSVRETEQQRGLREETATYPNAIMQISPEQGRFLQVLVRAVDARRCLEVGVFTGYSALAVALALPGDGTITACDISEEYAAVGRRYWTEAGVAHKIDLRIAPAADTLEALLTEGRAGSYDFAFIDADKTGYDRYYELALSLLRPGGVMALDNMLYHGQVHDLQFQDENTVALRALNLKISRDPRVTSSLVPMADGIHLAVKNRIA